MILGEKSYKLVLTTALIIIAVNCTRNDTDVHFAKYYFENIGDIRLADNQLYDSLLATRPNGLIQLRYVKKREFVRALSRVNVPIFFQSQSKYVRLHEYSGSQHFYRNNGTLKTNSVDFTDDQNSVLCPESGNCELKYFLVDEVANHYLFRVFYNEHPLSFLINKSSDIPYKQLPFETIYVSSINMFFSFDQNSFGKNHITLHLYHNNSLEVYKDLVLDGSILRPFVQGDYIYFIYTKSLNATFAKIRIKDLL